MLQNLEVEPQSSNGDSPLKVEHEGLRWLFVARFEDDVVVEQGADDKPKIQAGGSAFTDVCQTIEGGKKLLAFELNNAEFGAQVVVDLITGVFVVNGTPLIAHDQFFEPGDYELELVYFRETRVDQIHDVVDGKMVPVSSRHYVNRYFVGWKTEVNGEEKLITLAVG